MHPSGSDPTSEQPTWPVHPGEHPPVPPGGWYVPAPAAANPPPSAPEPTPAANPAVPPVPPSAPLQPPMQPPLAPPTAHPGMPYAGPAVPPTGPPPAGPRHLAGGAGDPSPKRSGGGRAGLAFFAGFLIAALLAGGAYALGVHTTNANGSAAANDTTTTSPPVTTGGVSTPLAASGEEPVAAIAKKVGPTVVQIETGSGLGSGFIYDKSGLILTAAHVTDTATEVTVRLADGTTQKGKVLGSDTGTDVAVVKIAPSSSLPVATLGTNTKLEVGQLAVAIGSPFGLDQTVTSGIVSAVGRTVSTQTGAVAMVQTDAPINPGNSGGALVDRQGEVIGINDQIESSSGTSSGVGFAIPISVAKDTADKIVAGKPITTAVLGVSGSDGSGGTSGALITDVSSGTPAQKAGLQQGDLVTKVDGKAISTWTDLLGAVRSHQPGDKITLSYERDGSSRTVTVTLASRTN